MADRSKYESLVGEDWVAHRYPKAFVREKTTGPERMKIAASEDGTDLLLRLASVLGAPFAVLYVLLVPRGDSAEGRYQSPWMGRAELTAFCERFGPFWDQDGRHHIWLFSGPDQATLVYDQHNVIFAYGPLDAYARLLEADGFSEAPELVFPAPHRHRYHAEFDDDERRLTALPGWERFPLQPEDDWSSRDD